MVRSRDPSARQRFGVIGWIVVVGLGKAVPRPASELARLFEHCGNRKVGWPASRSESQRSMGLRGTSNA